MKVVLSILIFLPTVAFGQAFNGLVKVTRDSIAIKWLPNNFLQFKMMLEGATVYRVEASQDVNPATLDFSSGLVGKITPAKERYQSLREFVPEEDKLLTLLSPFYEGTNDPVEENFAFGLSVIENVVNPQFQYVAGNIFVDKTFTRGKSYFYKI
jgi:hypothetical protein